MPAHKSIILGPVTSIDKSRARGCGVKNAPATELMCVASSRQCSSTKSFSSYESFSFRRSLQASAWFLACSLLSFDMESFRLAGYAETAIFSLGEISPDWRLHGKDLVSGPGLE